MLVQELGKTCRSKNFLQIYWTGAKFEKIVALIGFITHIEKVGLQVPKNHSLGVNIINGTKEQQLQDHTKIQPSFENEFTHSTIPILKFFLIK